MISLEDLPVGSIIMDSTGEVFRKNSYVHKSPVECTYSEWWDMMGTEEIGCPTLDIQILWIPPTTNRHGRKFDE